MEKDVGLTLGRINNHMGYIAQQIEKGELDLQEAKVQLDAWKTVFYTLAKEKELAFKERDVKVVEKELELKEEDQKAIEALISTIKTGLKGLDKKATAQKQGGRKKCQKK